MRASGPSCKHGAPIRVRASPVTARRMNERAGMGQLTIGHMMKTDVKALHEDDSLAAADWDLLVSEVRHLPVVDHARRVVGIVSDRDVLRAAAKRPGERLSVASVMTRDVQTCAPSLPAVEAVVQLLQAKRGALPVVDDQGVLVGIVTTTDFVELAHRALAGLDIQRPSAHA
jgi:CBS domain-containing membrane protein